MPVPNLLPRLAVCLAALAVPALADDSPFAIEERPSDGRTVAAELVDVDGDERLDLVQIVFVGFPPKEARRVRVFRQADRGALPLEPDLVWPLPEGCAAYDVADVAEAPGSELVLLRARDVLLVSFAGSEPQVEAVALPEPSLAASQDERGLDRARLVWTELGPEPWLFAPLAGEFVAVAADGSERARFRVGTSSNYLLPARPGPSFVESEVQLFLDVPVLGAGDVDGDGRTDLVAASRHDVRVFRQREGGSFPRDPDQRLLLGRIEPRDHLRGSGSVLVQWHDLDGDGRLDAMVSAVTGALTDAHTRTTMHLNRAGTWNLAKADQEFSSESAWTGEQVVDLDGDGTTELMRVRIPITVLEVVEILITRAVDAQVSVHRMGADGRFEAKPWQERKLGIPISFQTGRPKGFLPTANADLNGDGVRDFLISGDGDALEIFLGGAPHWWSRRHARQELPTQGRVRFGDWNGDGLEDLVLYAPRIPDAPLRIGTNLGRLPGTPARPPRMEPATGG